jgi:N-methylhydantoinase A
VRNAILEQIGKPLGMAADEAAAAVLHIANNHMAGAMRMVSLARGHDPRDFALFAFGGAGPLHAPALARELAIPKLLIPARPGITNAIGCVVADVRHDYVNTINRPLADLDMDLVRRTLEEQIADGKATIEREGVEIEELVLIHQADMQFQGQSHLLTVAVDDVNVSREALQAAFDKAYWNRFAVELPEIRAVLVNLHTAVIGRRRGVSLETLTGADAAATLEEARSGSRQVWFAEGWVETPIYARDRLPKDAAFDGPAIIEQLDTTIVVEPGNHVQRDEHGNLVISIEGGQV